MLEISGLHVGYGDGNIAVHDLNLTVAARELVTVIGPNGAGKTTVLKAISEILRPSQGKIVFEGQDITGARPDKLVQMGIVHVPEGRMVFGQMTTRDNLLLGAFTRRDNVAIASDLAYVTKLFPRLQERMEQLAGTLSGGEQQMLAIGRGLMSGPRLLILDEPSLGIAPLLVVKIFEAIKEIRETRKISIILVEQNASRALAVADRGYVLDLGRTAAAGSAAALLADDRIRRAYLGI